MSRRLQLDITRMFADAVGKDFGVSRDEVDALEPRLKALLQGLEAKRKGGTLPFYDLCDAEDRFSRIEDYAAKARTKFKNVVVLGIGGSALGAVALREALKPLHWNELPDDKRDAPRLFVPDNSDPELLAAIMDICPPEETLYNIITKSGTTGETMAAFLAILTPLKEALGDKYREHLVFTTDPAKGNLRELSRTEGITSFTIPPGVGGRFSIFTPVGLLPAALLGIDIRKMMSGVAEQRERIFNRNFDENPSVAYATLQFLSNSVRGQNIHVMMPYSNAMFRTADWFRQLWAESLGKRNNLKGDTVFTGPTPVAALGATDQHSQVQLYVEGPNDKTFTFIFPKHYRRKVKSGKHFPDMEAIDYLAGKGMDELIIAEGKATQRALTSAHRPNMAFIMEEIAEDTVAGLMYILEAATLVAGGLYEVNPLDQPGVEAGKIATYALLGKSGYEEERATIQKEDEREARII
ncbi:glucose-6-phosphate isomerase [bacterium]|nr:glucose-6-phosphate isomerase [bacterium]